MKVRVAPQATGEMNPAEEGNNPRQLSKGEQATVDYGLKLLGVKSVSDLYGDGELNDMSISLSRGSQIGAVSGFENGGDGGNGRNGDIKSTTAFDPKNEEHIKYAYAGLASAIRDLDQSITDGSDTGAQMAFNDLNKYVALINDPNAQSNALINVYNSDSSLGNPISIEVDYDLNSSIYDGQKWSASGHGDALVWNIGSDGVNYGITNPGNSMFAGSKAKNKPAMLWRDAYYNAYESGNLTPQENLKMLYRSGSINDQGNVTAGLGSLIGIDENDRVNPYVLHSMISDRVAEGRINSGRTVVQQPTNILPNPFRPATASR